MKFAWPAWRSSLAAASGAAAFAESTLAQAAWQRTRRAVARWGIAGALCGAVVGVVAFAPASWLAAAVASASEQRLLLSDARGTIWNGSAVPVLTGGAQSRTAAALPGRLSWQLALRLRGVDVRLLQACCMATPMVLRVQPGLSRLSVQLMPHSGSLGEWPADWLSGLGAPWNTLQLGGTLRLTSPGLTVQEENGRWHLLGRAELELNNIASRLSTLERLGSYRLSLDGSGANGAQMNLQTLDGALIMTGSGSWTAAQLRFRGEARAAPGFESALNNLLNILGRRQGAASLISIG